MAIVRFFAPDTDAFDESVVRHADEFTQSTRLELDCRIIPSDVYGAGHADVRSLFR